MIYQVNIIKDGIHTYLLDPKGKINTLKGQMEIDVPTELTTEPDSLIKYVKQVVMGRLQADF